MSIPISKTILATKSGSAIKQVTCEACGCQYYYELARASIGSAESLFGLQDETAELHAKKGAQELLGKALKQDSEVVPCPQCGLIQQRMVANARRRKYLGLSITGFLMLALGLVYVFVGLILDAANQDQ